MRVLVQWTTSTPGDWQAFDSATWDSVPHKPEPRPAGAPEPSEPLDDRPGWPCAICCQGVTFEGFDHFAVEHLEGGGCRIHAWRDDPDDWPDPQDRTAIVGTFQPLRQDPLSGYGWNTDQYFDIFLGSNVRNRWPAKRERTTYHPIESFQAPDAALHRHCIWARSEAHHLAHRGARSAHGWREWTEGVPRAWLDANGRLRQQRCEGLFNRPRGSQTFYQGSNAAAVGAWTASQELAFESSAQSSSGSEEVRKGSDELVFSWVTGSGVPGVAWPTGDYRCQLDVSDANAALSYGFLTLTGSTGFFARLASDLASTVDTKAQSEGAFSGTGTKTATTGSVSWSGSDTSDRFGCLLAAENSDTKTNYTLYLTFDADAWADGPWSVGATNISLAGYGIASAEALGSPAVAPGGVSVSLASQGIASAEALGTPTIFPTYDISLASQGIASAEALGTPSVSPGAVSVDLGGEGIASAEALGSPTISTGGVSVDLDGEGIVSAEALGTPAVVQGGTSIDLAGEGIATAEALGTPAVVTGAVSVSLAGEGIASAEAFGTPAVVLASGPQSISLASYGIASAEALGTPTVAPGTATVDLGGEGIASAEAFGNPTLLPTYDVDLSGQGIASGEALGTPTVAPGSVAIDLTTSGIASAEALGLPSVVPGSVAIDLATSGIPSAEAFGSPAVQLSTGQSISLLGQGIASLEAWGFPTVLLGFLDGIATVTIEQLYQAEVAIEQLYQAEVTIDQLYQAAVTFEETMGTEGNVWRAKVTFEVIATRERVAPDDVTLFVKTPAGSVTSYVYGVDPEAKSAADSEGTYYYIDVAPTAPGRWWVAGQGFDALGEPYAGNGSSQMVDDAWWR